MGRTARAKATANNGYHYVATLMGFGDPVQSLFKFGDGERVVEAGHFPHVKTGTQAEGEFFVVMENGNGFRFAKSSIVETTKAGRKFASVREGDSVLDVIPLERKLIYVAHDGGKGLLFKADEAPLLTGPGSGVRLIKLHEGQKVFGAKNVDKGDKLTFLFSSGRDETVRVSDMEIGGRAGAGRVYGGPKKKLMGLTHV